MIFQLFWRPMRHRFLYPPLAFMFTSRQHQDSTHSIFHFPDLSLTTPKNTSRSTLPHIITLYIDWSLYQWVLEIIPGGQGVRMVMIICQTVNKPTPRLDPLVHIYPNLRPISMRHHHSPSPQHEAGGHRVLWLVWTRMMLVMVWTATPPTTTTTTTLAPQQTHSSPIDH